MSVDWSTFLPFLFIMSISPGPNNLTSAALGVRGGFRLALPFALGVYLGVAGMLVLVGLLKLVISDFFFRYVLMFKIVGSAYLMWLAWTMVRPKTATAAGRADASLLKGMILQLVNPKTLFFTMTLYALFFTTPMTAGQTVLLSFIVPLVTIVCVSTWGSAGAILSRFLENPRYRRIFDFVAAAMLVYTVATILFREFTPA